MTTTSSTTGASWLLTQPDPESTFTPEQLSDEHRLMAQTVEEFMTTEVLPQIDQLETKDWALARRLLNRAGELVGMTFDGNLESMPNTYLYTDDQARGGNDAVVRAHHRRAKPASAMHAMPFIMSHLVQFQNTNR